MTPASPEYQMIRTYLDWLLDVPWAKRTEDRLDPIEARACSTRITTTSTRSRSASSSTSPCAS